MAYWILFSDFDIIRYFSGSSLLVAVVPHASFYIDMKYMNIVLASVVMFKTHFSTIAI